MEYNRNFFVAIALSMLIMLGWFYLAGPENRTVQKNAEIARQIKQDMRQAPATGEDDADAQSAAAAARNQPAGEREQPAVEMTGPARSAAVNEASRIEIDTPELKGSINLAGARLDDLLLKNYRMTVEKDSPNIALLNPARFKQGYVADVDFLSVAGGARVPDQATLWQVEGANRRLTPQTPVQLVFDNGAGLVFHRKISVDDKYMFTFEDSVTNTGGAAVSLAASARVFRLSLPETASGNSMLHEGLIGALGSSGIKTRSYSDMSGAKGADRVVRFSNVSDGGWVGITDKYWAVAVIPAQNVTYNATFSFSDAVNTRYQSELTSQAFVVNPGATGAVTTRVFAGAKQVDVLDGYENRLGIHQFGFMIDWGRLGVITKPMFTLIDWLYRLVGNFGVAILLVTVILKAVLFPLANKSYKSMARMRNVQPAMLEIREKYAEDKVKQQQAIMELYRKEKINPLAGCWPLIVQFPIFFALYKVLYITIEMRHAPFFGWIQDLAAPDPTSLFNLFGALPYDVPHFLVIGAWPIIMGITMFLQMRMNPTPPDPTQAMIFTWMPVVFTWMLAAFPAGLVIYWAWNNTLSIIQQSIIMKRQGVKIELFDNLKTFFTRKPAVEGKK